MNTHETPRSYNPEHLNTKEIEFEGGYYTPETTDYLRDKIREKYQTFLKKLERRKKNVTLTGRVKECEELFINESIFNIALYIAECSEKDKGVCCEDIAKEFGIKDIKFIHNKLPFLRKIFQLIGLELKTTFADKVTTPSPKAKVKSIKIPIHMLSKKESKTK
jgi:hypothetical protein